MKTIRNLTRALVIKSRTSLLKAFWGYRISDTTKISFSAHLDKTNPTGIEIGSYTLIARGAVVLSHDYTRSLKTNTKIGKCCLIGTNAIILPGVSIGDNVVVGAGAVVTRDVSSNSLVAGNPARPLRKIETTSYGKIVNTITDNDKAPGE